MDRVKPGSAGEATRLSLSIPADRRVVRPLRQFVGELCRAGGMSARSTREVRLAVTELFENAVEHGSTDGDCVSVRITIQDRTMRFTLTESCPTPEKVWKAMQRKIESNRRPAKGFDDPRGWGLRLVASFVDRWRATRLEGGRLRVSFVKRG